MDEKGSFVDKIGTSITYKEKISYNVSLALCLIMAAIFFIIGLVHFLKNENYQYILLGMSAWAFSFLIFYFSLGGYNLTINIYKNGFEEIRQYKNISKIIYGKRKRFVSWKDIIKIYPNSEKFGFSTIAINSGKSIHIERENLEQFYKIAKNLGIHIPLDLNYNITGWGKLEKIDNKNILSWVVEKNGDYKFSTKLVYDGPEKELIVDKKDAYISLIPSIIIIILMLIAFYALLMWSFSSWSMSLIVLSPLIILFTLGFVFVERTRVPKKAYITKDNFEMEFEDHKELIKHDAVYLSNTLRKRNKRLFYWRMMPESGKAKHAILSKNIIDYLRKNSDKFKRE